MIYFSWDKNIHIQINTEQIYEQYFLNFIHFSVFHFHKNSSVLNNHPSDLTMHSLDYVGSFSFLSYMVSLNVILLLWNGSPLLCPCLQGSLLLQTHQLCDISKAWYDTCFISLAVKGLHFCQMPPYREKVKLFSQRMR